MNVTEFTSDLDKYVRQLQAITNSENRILNIYTHNYYLDRSRQRNLDVDLSKFKQFGDFEKDLNEINGIKSNITNQMSSHNDRLNTINNETYKCVLFLSNPAFIIKIYILF